MVNTLSSRNQHAIKYVSPIAGIAGVMPHATKKMNCCSNAGSVHKQTVKVGKEIRIADLSQLQHNAEAITRKRLSAFKKIARRTIIERLMQGLDARRHRFAAPIRAKISTNVMRESYSVSGPVNVSGSRVAIVASISRA